MTLLFVVLFLQAERYSRAAQQEVLAGVQVVAATCAGAGDPILSDR